jgi:hypothetical protein
VGHRLDVVAVRVQCVRGVVARVVVRAEAGGTVVAAARRERSFVEGDDGRTVGSGGGEVDWRCRFAFSGRKNLARAMESRKEGDP